MANRLQIEIEHVPLAVHEDNLGAFFDVDRETGARVPDEDLEQLVQAMRQARTQAEQVVSLAKALRGDATVTPDAAALRLRQGALKLGERAAQALDKAGERVSAAIARLETETSGPPLSGVPGAGLMEMEIRAALARMSDGERTEAVGQAFEDNDEAVLGAVLRGPGLLSGLGIEKQGMARERWRRTYRPAETARIERLRKALAAAERGGQSLLDFTAAAASTQQALQAENAAARTQEALNNIAAG